MKNIMDKLLIVPVVCFGLILSACGGAAGLNGVPAAQPGPAAVVADKVVFKGTQAFALAELTYLSIAQSALAATRAGLIRGTNATALRALNRKATAALETGNAAVSESEKARQAAVVLDSVAGICRLGIVDRVCRAFNVR